MLGSDSDDGRSTVRTSRSSPMDGVKEMIAEMPPQQKVAAGGCGCCCFLWFLLASIQGLHATQYALVRNTWTGVVHLDNVYYGGRNAIGFWNTYVEFPATVQTIEWSKDASFPGVRDLSPFHVRTADGLMVTLSVVAKYHIVRDKVPDIYRLFKDKVEEFFVSNLRSELQETLATFPMTEIYTNRLELDSQMEVACRKVCQEALKGYLSCWRLSLLDVGLHADIEKMNQREQVEKQKQRTMMMKRNATMVRTNMEVMAADFNRQKMVVLAEAEAAAYNITVEADADAMHMQTKASAESLGAIEESFQAVGVAPSSYQLLSYLEKLTIMEEPSGPMVYGAFESVGASMRLDLSQPQRNEL